MLPLKFHVAAIFTVNPFAARLFVTNFVFYQSFCLSVRLAAGAKVEENRLEVEDIADAAKAFHDRMRGLKSEAPRARL